MPKRARMMDLPAIRIGDQVEMRKPHACGANSWTIVRTGADIRIRCDQCGRAVMLPRTRFVRAVRKYIQSPSATPTGDQR